eukprot:jgi/Botrbrau1/633/Bobra.0161s0024.2
MQADVYRIEGNDLQLYTMLMRYASLIVETIPKHKDFSSADPGRDYRNFKKVLAERYFPELEGVKLRLKLSAEAHGKPVEAVPARRDPEAVQLTTSNVPSINWAELGSSPTPPAGQALDLGFLDDVFVRQGSLTNNAHITEQNMDLLTGQLKDASLAPVLPTFQTYGLPPASEAARNRHALLPTVSARRSSLAVQQQQGPLYPTVANLMDAPILTPQPSEVQHSGQGLMQPAVTSDSSFMPALRPQLELQLGPQEFEVTSVEPPTRPLQGGEVCSHTSDAVVPALGVDQPGGPSKQKQGIREVHISFKLMDDFLRYAVSNTRRGIESCGILAGTLSTETDGSTLFRIDTLIIPKQEGTSDTVQALSEEEIFEVQDSRSLYPLGWIHTHPTQTCFLSSIDVHTQCGYQTMLDEAIAIVMAPRDTKSKCGLFRLSTPGGLSLVQKCTQRGFHAHAPTSTGQPLYELCGHVFVNPRVDHQVLDLR